MSKFIFVTGGIVSGIGKGITVASLGLLLKSRGLKVIPVKIDPYLNQDAGTMNPFQHGEVFVTDDGAETDLDLGHYERFIDQNLTQASNFTTGAVYQTVTAQERVGEFLGNTIQIIPHVTDEIKKRIKNASKGVDVVLVEIGGTVGDIEALPFIEAIRQLKQEINPSDFLCIHVVKIDYVYPSDEAKTKPIQQSVQMLRGLGLQPDFLICRCKRAISQEIRAKIALFTSVRQERIIQAIDAGSLYQIPINLEKEKLGTQICQFFGWKNKKVNLSQWQKIIGKIENPKATIRVAMVGKYLHHPDAYLSVVEALKHAAIQNLAKIEIIPVDSEKNNLQAVLKKIDAIVVPGGFGIRGIEGKITAIKYARENKIPFLGLCLGLQCAVIEFGRDVCRLKGANSTEFNPKTKYPIIDYLPEQRHIAKKGGTMRLGQYPAKLKPGSLAARLYFPSLSHVSRLQSIFERHRHRYEVNPKYHQILQKNGLIFSGISPNNFVFSRFARNKKLVEIIELPQKIHPYFIATQAHPEFKSRPNRAHPLFDGLIKTALK